MENTEKKCTVCFKLFLDNSKRKKRITCSKFCSYKMGVLKRHQNGSYLRTSKQNEKMVETIKTLRENGKIKLSENAKEKLSFKLKEKWKTEEFKEKCKNTCLEKYGTDHQSKSLVIKEKIKNKNLELYGTEYATQSDIVKEKTKNTRIKNRITYIFDNKTMKEISEDIGISYSYFKQLVNEKGFDVAKRIVIKKSLPETIIENFLIENKIDYFYDSKKFKSYRPDFLLENYKTIIEVDGLYWHCDKIKNDKNYHFNKKNFYKENGYESYFFRSDEIENKRPIVESIIKNKLGLNENKIGSRECSLMVFDHKNKQVELNEFFIENHLMGVGKGRIYALLYKNNIVSVMQVCWVSKKEKILEISRFCNKTNYSIHGSFSRLLKHVEIYEKPATIKTYIDARYGSGSYLTNFGFKYKSNNLSFSWTNYKNTFHRMKFKNNSGYDNGLYKIWDCGQISYIKNL